MPPRKRSRRAGGAAESHSSAVHELTADAGTRLTLSNEMGRMWRDKMLCDVTIVVDGVEVLLAHMVVLAAGCGYFRALCGANWSERSGDRVELREMDADAVLAVVTFLYTGTCEFTPASLPLIMRAASRLDATPMLVQLSAFLEDHLAPDNCLSTHEVCSALERPELASLLVRCENVLLHQFPDVSATPEFLRTPASLVSRILRSDRLNADEDAVFEAFKRWHDAQPPSGSSADLVEHVRLEQMRAQSLQRVEQDVLSISPRGHELMMRAYRAHAVPGSSPSRPRLLSMALWDADISVKPELAEHLQPLLDGERKVFELRTIHDRDDTYTPEYTWQSALAFSHPVHCANFVWELELTLHGDGFISSDQLAFAVSSDRFPFSSVSDSNPLHDVGTVNAVLFELERAFWMSDHRPSDERFAVGVKFYIEVVPKDETTTTIAMRAEDLRVLETKEMPRSPQYRLAMCPTYCNMSMALKGVHSGIEAVRAAQ